MDTIAIMSENMDTPKEAFQNLDRVCMLLDIFSAVVFLWNIIMYMIFLQDIWKLMECFLTTLSKVS